MIKSLSHSFSIKQNWTLLFSRSSERYPIFDGLRALSIIFVIFFHLFLGYLGTQFSYDSPEFLDLLSRFPSSVGWLVHGDKGVDVFFMISGFLLGVPLINRIAKDKPISIRLFYTRRFARIMPIYIFVIILFALFNLNNISIILPYLLFLQNFLPASVLKLHHTWSLCVEMHFYIVLPFIIIAMRKIKRPLLFLCSLFAIACGYRVWVIYQHPLFYQTPIYKFICSIVPGQNALYETLYLNTFTRCSPIVLGLILAYVFTNHQLIVSRFLSRHPQLSRSMIFIGVLCIIGILFLPILNPSSFYNVNFNPRINFLYLAFSRQVFCIGVALISGLSLCRAPGTRWITTLLSSRVWRPFSELVLPLYLFHIAFLLLTGTLIAEIRYNGALSKLTVLDAGIIGLLTLITSMIFSIIVHLLIERPCMNLRPNRLKLPSVKSKNSSAPPK